MQKVIKANVLFDGKERQENVYLIIENDQIVDITKNIMRFDFEGIVTPAFIDAHSHIGMFREGEPSSEQEGNDLISQFLPLNDPLNSVYFDDRAFKDAVDFGVLYSCIVPGSGNLLGGQAKIIKNYASNKKDALYCDYGYKMALGYNPRSTTSWKGERPNTRMGIYAMLEDKFDSVLQKEEKQTIIKNRKIRELDKKLKENKICETEYKIEKEEIGIEFNLEFNQQELEILNLIKGDKTVKIHVHKEDDVLYMIDFVKKYNLKATAEHTCDVHHKEIFNELAKNNIPVVYGPLGGVGGKVELLHAYYQNAKELLDSNAYFGLMTDHPVVWSPSLRDSLKFFMIYGVSEEDAISIITYKNAKILGIDDKLGSLEIGKTASLTVWNNNPLHLSAYPKMVMAEGKVIRGREY